MMKERQPLFESGGAVCRDGTAAHGVVGKLKRGAVCGAPKPSADPPRGSIPPRFDELVWGALQVMVSEVTHYSDALLNLAIHYFVPTRT